MTSPAEWNFRARHMRDRAAKMRAQSKQLLDQADRSDKLADDCVKMEHNPRLGEERAHAIKYLSEEIIKAVRSALDLRASDPHTAVVIGAAFSIAIQEIGNEVDSSILDIVDISLSEKR